MTLAHNVYEKQEEKFAAVCLVRNVIASGRRQQDLPTSGDNKPAAPLRAPAPLHSNSSPDKRAHNIGMRLKDRDKKFSGSIGECWQEFVDE